MTQVEAARALSDPDDQSKKCSVANVRDWEQGRSEPAGWYQWLIVGQLMRGRDG